MKDFRLMEKTFGAESEPRNGVRKWERKQMANQNHLAYELQAIAKANGVKQADITRDKGLNPSHLSRIFNGQQTYVTDDDLVAIADVICKDNEERARLLKARMMDVCNGAGSELIEVIIKRDGKRRKEDMTPKVTLPPELRSAFHFLMELAPKNKNIGPAIVGLAKAMGLQEGG